MKFTEVIDLQDWDVYADSGWKPIKKVMRTIPYPIYVIDAVSMDGNTTFSLSGADKHLVILEDGSECPLEALREEQIIKTIDGMAKVISTSYTGCEKPCFDLEVNSDNHLYYTNGILSHNTTCSASYILHQAITRPNITIALLANKEDTAKEILERVKFSYMELPYYMKPGVLEWNKKSIKLSNGSKGVTIFAAPCTKDSIRGKSTAIIYIDEMAHVRQAEEFYSAAYPALASSKKSQLIVTSTPNGMNLFKELWDGASRGTNSFKQVFAPWYRHPDRDEEWKKVTIGLEGERKFQQEFACEFQGSANTLLSIECLTNLHSADPIETSQSMNIYEHVQELTQYFICVDVAEGTGNDYSVVNVIKVTPEKTYEQVAIYRDNMVFPENLAEVVYSMGMRYNEAYIVVENNSIGKIVADMLYYDMEYENILTSKSRYGETELREGVYKLNVGVRQTAKTKGVGCAAMKSLIESKSLIIKDLDTIFELNSFIRRGNSYKAEEGLHDDCVMTLVLFGWLTKQSIFKELAGFDISERMREQLRGRAAIPFNLFSKSGEPSETSLGMGIRVTHDDFSLLRK